MPLGPRIRELLATGHTIGEISETLGVATNTVAYHRDRAAPQPFVAPDLRHTVSHVETREAVATLLAEGLSRAEIARRLGVNRSTVTYHVNRLGSARDDRGARRYDWVAVQAFYDCGFTVRECRQAFGFSHQTWHAAVKRGDIVSRSGHIPDEELFVKGSRRSRKHLKARLLAGDLKPPICAACGIAEWRGQPLSLAVHHINGDRDDHRVENLELLCPNCHSQTDNFAGRNRRRKAA